MKLRWLLLSWLTVAGCGGARTPGFDHCTPPTGGVSQRDALDHYTKLHDFCVVDAVGGKLALNPQAVPYDLTSPLFSDYAIKERAAWLPPGTHATYNEDGPFDFPVGTILTKTFAFAPDLRQPSVGEKLVETRLLVRSASEWVALPYVWNEAQTEATLDVAGSLHPMSFVAPSGNSEHAQYLVPQLNQCGQCHDALQTQLPIGPKARTLNKDYAYPQPAATPGATPPPPSVENQLVHWARAGILAGAPSDPATAPKLATWDDPAADVGTRARAWLEANCAHCHSDKGLARTTGLLLGASISDEMSYGICKSPVAAGPATGGRLYDIVPGKPDQSILVFRIEATDPGIMMPELGRSVVHAEGVSVVRQWIASLPGSCPGT